MAIDHDRAFSEPTEVLRDRSAVCRSVLGRLPEWFGRLSALEAYLSAAATLPLLACHGPDGAAIGILSLKPQTTAAIEVHVMGVLSAWQRRGTGRALIEAAARYAAGEGAKLLTVKTLAPGHPDPNYAATRAFYEALGFLPVEVFPTLWAEDIPCLLMIKPVSASRREPAAFDASAIEAAERQILDASTRRSPQAAAALLADEFVEFGRSGHVTDKAATLDGLREEHRAGGVPSLEAEDLRVRPLGERAALVTYRSLRRRPDRPATVSLRSSVWVQSQDGWRMMFHQGTPAAASRQAEARMVVAAGYDRIADHYLARFGRSSVRDRKLKELLDELRPGGSVLDLGCGAGVPVARALVGHGVAYTGVDVSTAQIARARANVPEARFIAADIADIGFAPKTFDAVCAFYALSHVPRGEHAALLRRIADWLRPGGILLASFGAQAGDWSGEWLGVPMVFSHNAPDLTLSLVTAAGLMVERAETLPQDNEEAAFLWITARRG